MSVVSALSSSLGTYVEERKQNFVKKSVLRERLIIGQGERGDHTVVKPDCCTNLNY